MSLQELSLALCRYGLGELGRMVDPLLGRGELGKMVDPLFGRGELGSIVDPLFFVVRTSLEYEIARFVNAASKTVMNTARNLFTVTLELILTSVVGNDVRAWVTFPVILVSLKYANLKLMSRVFFDIKKEWRICHSLSDFSTGIFFHIVHIFEKTDDFA
jgi:hypothetical protein